MINFVVNFIVNCSEISTYCVKRWFVTCYAVERDTPCIGPGQSGQVTLAFMNQTVTINSLLMSLLMSK